MKNIVLLFTLLLIPVSSFAACYGSDSFHTCNDNSGNTYNIQKIGDTTYVMDIIPELEVIGLKKVCISATLLILMVVQQMVILGI